jgi:hypothetical protein
MGLTDPKNGRGRRAPTPGVTRAESRRSIARHCSVVIAKAVGENGLPVVTPPFWSHGQSLDDRDCRAVRPPCRRCFAARLRTA